MLDRIWWEPKTTLRRMFLPKVNIFSHHARCLPARAYPRKNHGSSIYSFLVRITPSLPPPHPSGAAPPRLPPPSSSRAVPTGGSGGGRPGASEPPPDLGAAGLGAAAERLAERGRRRKRRPPGAARAFRARSLLPLASSTSAISPSSAPARATARRMG